MKTIEDITMSVTGYKKGDCVIYKLALGELEEWQKEIRTEALDAAIEAVDGAFRDWEEGKTNTFCPAGAIEDLKKEQ